MQSAEIMYTRIRKRETCINIFKTNFIQTHQNDPLTICKGELASFLSFFHFRRTGQRELLQLNTESVFSPCYGQSVSSFLRQERAKRRHQKRTNC